MHSNNIKNQILTKFEEDSSEIGHIRTSQSARQNSTWLYPLNFTEQLPDRQAQLGGQGKPDYRKPLCQQFNDSILICNLTKKIYLHINK